MLQTKGVKTKTIEHYTLLELTVSTPLYDFWTGNHQILKKPFTIKRIHDRQNGAIGPSSPSSISTFDIAQAEATNLTLVKGKGAPKCRKLIKTTSHSYLIFDLFPDRSLEGVIANEDLDSTKALKLLLELCLELQAIHRLGFVLFTLNPATVLLSDDGVLLSDWTLATRFGKQADSDLVRLLSAHNCFMQGSVEACEQTDLFSLSRIFEAVLYSSKARFSENVQSVLKRLAARMIQQKMEPGQKLPEVLKALQQTLRGAQQEELEITKSTSTASTAQLRKAGTHFHARVSSDNAVQIEKLKSLAGQVSVHNLTRINTMGGLHPASSLSNLQLPSEKGELEILSRSIFKQRSLSLFLLRLCRTSSFQDPILTLLLLKKALVAARIVEEHSNRIKSESVILAIKVGFLVKSETQKIQNLIAKLDRFVNAEVTQDPLFKQQTTDQTVHANPDYFQRRVREFVRVQLGRMGDDRKDLVREQQFLFELYLLAKTIECGSYETFWDQVYRSQESVSGIDGYLKYQRKLGLRYFRSKISSLVDSC